MKASPASKNAASPMQSLRHLKTKIFPGITDDRVRSLFISLVTDFLLFLPDVVAAVMANSVILLADILKCACEILATFFSWLALKKITKGGATGYEYGFGKIESLTGMFVAAIMALCFITVMFTAVYRIMNPEALHAAGAGLGIFLMLCGVCVNSWLWRKNYNEAKKEVSPIMESQWRLFRAKAFADFVVLITLLISLGLKNYGWAAFADPVGSVIIAGFLMFSIYSVATHSVYDLLDKTLDEATQLIIIRKLVAFYEDYRILHGMRSRRSGKDIFIDIFLEFEGEMRMAEVQNVIDRMKRSIEKDLPGSTVSIIPSSQTHRKKRHASG